MAPDQPDHPDTTAANIGLVQPALPPAAPRLPLDLTAVAELARTVVAAGVLPTPVTTTERAVAVILVGRELGIDPMLALRSITIDRGKVVVAADLQLALFKRDGGRSRWERNDIDGVALRVRHPNGDEFLAEFTPADAVRAGLWHKAGPWTEYPVAMMRARAITAALKAVGYAPTAGAYDDVSEELPRSTAAGTGGRALATRASGHASRRTLAAIDGALRAIRRLSPEVGERATTWYAGERAVLERSEVEAQRTLRRLRRRLATLHALGAIPSVQAPAAGPPEAGRTASHCSAPHAFVATGV